MSGRQAVLLPLVLVIPALLEGCVIGAAAIGAKVYSDHETRKSLGRSVEAYEEAAQEVRIGDRKEAVLARLEPSQRHLKDKLRREPHRYERDGSEIEIYYFRSDWLEDGLITDDEFTPYIFKDGRLIHIGWRTLTGPRTWGRPP